jgi:hypothetical protein
MNLSCQSEREELFRLLNDYIQSGGMQPSYDDLVSRIFAFQYRYNKVYRDYCIRLGNVSGEIRPADELIFLPVSAFKHYEVKSGDWESEVVFRSSATTGSVRSCHYVRDLDFYKWNALRIWNNVYGNPAGYCILALLPGYLERHDASLVAMVDHLMKVSGHNFNGYFLNHYEALRKKLEECREQKIPTVLFGVSFALLDFVRAYTFDFPELIVMETGGLKGRYQAMPREEIHDRLKKGFGVGQIHSEYGMTELFSQAYSGADGLYSPSDTLHVITKQINDPLTHEIAGKSGIICAVDLANIDTCSFIQTEDVGVVHEDNSFIVQGRLDYSELRGCNLMIDS